MEGSFTGVVSLIPKPGKIDEVIAEAVAFAKIVEEKEPGVIMFAISRSKSMVDENEPEEVVLAVTFKDKDAQIAHSQTEHRKAFQAKSDLTDGTVKPKAHTFVGGFKPRA